MKSIKFTYLFVALLCSMPALTQTNLVSTSTSVLSYPTNVTIQPPSFDVSEETKAGEMYEFAKVIPTSISILESNMVEVENGRVWTVSVFSEGAKALSLYYNEFWIPLVVNYMSIILSKHKLLVLLPQSITIVLVYLPMNSSKVMR